MSVTTDEYGRYFIDYPYSGGWSACFPPKAKKEETEDLETQVIVAALNNVVTLTRLATNCKDSVKQDNLIGFLDDVIGNIYNYSRTRFECDDEL
jgi:hypothetical protein